MDFNVFDAIVISITLLLAIKGWFNGIIKEIAGLIGLVLGLFLASSFYKEVGQYINNSITPIPNESAINVVGFISIFIVVRLGIIGVGFLFSKLIHISQLGFLDRIGGLLFSGGKFFVIVSVNVTLLSQIESLKPKIEKYEKSSLVYPIMRKVGDTLIDLKPEEIKGKIEKAQKEIVNNLPTDKIKEKVSEIKKQIEEKAKGE